MLSNLSETLHSSTKLKSKQVTKFWSLLLNKQKFGTTMQFPECLENTPFNKRCSGAHFVSFIFNYYCTLNLITLICKDLNWYSTPEVMLPYIPYIHIVLYCNSSQRFSRQDLKKSYISNFVNRNSYCISLSCQKVPRSDFQSQFSI